MRVIRYNFKITVINTFNKWRISWRTRIYQKYEVDILKLKNTIIKIKNRIDGFNREVDTIEAMTRKLLIGH